MRYAIAVVVWILLGACASSEEQTAPKPEEPSVRTRGLTDTRMTTTTTTNTLLVQNVRSRFATYVSNPSETNRTAFETYVEGQTQTSPDIMSALFQVFRESIEQANADKQYMLERLAYMNEITEALGDYLEQNEDVATIFNTPPSESGECTCGGEAEPAGEEVIRSGINLENLLGIRRKSVTDFNVGRDIDTLLAKLRRERTVFTAMSLFVKRLMASGK